MGDAKSDAEGGQSTNEQMNFLASAEQKERWQEYAEEMGFRNLSGLFRFAIEKEVNGDGNGAVGGSIPDDLTEQFSELMEGMNRIESRVQDLDQRLSGIESEVREDPEIKQLASEVFAVLPTKDEIIDYYVNDLYKEGPATGGTIEGIASELDEVEYRVKDALDRLQKDTHQVGQTTLRKERQKQEINIDVDDEPRYYKES